jgi:hypothetical protein
LIKLLRKDTYLKIKGNAKADGNDLVSTMQSIKIKS